MKSNFKAKFLAYLLPKHSNEAGYTLIELIMVILIIGILSAIAIPSILSRANKGRQVEAKLFVGSMNRGQQAYHLENDVFSSSVDELGTGIKPQTDNYRYTISLTPGATVVTNNGMSLKASLKSYVGVTYLNPFVTVAGGNDTLLLAILCENPSVGIGTPQSVKSGTCPPDWILLPK